MAKGNYKIPFSEDGNQQDYPQHWWVHTGNVLKRTLSDGRVVENLESRQEGPAWKDNFEFDDTLTLVDYGRGRSSVTFTLRRTDGTKSPDMPGLALSKTNPVEIARSLKLSK